MKLYDTVLSGNCHKVRLLLSILGRDYETVPVDLLAREQKTPEFLALNPLGKVPVLDDGGQVIWDSQAILVYLAGKYGGDAWWPGDPRSQGEIMQWLALAANEMWHGPAMARAIIKFKRDADLEVAQANARDVLGILEGRLGDHDWLALDRPTIADMACYPYAGLVWEGGVTLDPYPAVIAWLERVEALPGYAGMEGLGRGDAPAR